MTIEIVHGIEGACCNIVLQCKIICIFIESWLQHTYLIERAAERPNITFTNEINVILKLSIPYFRCHIYECAYIALLLLIISSVLLCTESNSPITYFEVSFPSDIQILWFYVQVHSVILSCEAESFDSLHQYFKHLDLRETVILLLICVDQMCKVSIYNIIKLELKKNLHSA